MTGTKIKLWPWVLAVLLVGGIYSGATGKIFSDGKDVTFTASWYAAPGDQARHVGTDNAHVTWHILPSGAVHNQVHHGGYYSETTTVVEPGVYTAVLNVTTDAPTRLGCKVKAGGLMRRDPKSDDKNPGSGRCHILLQFTVS